MKAHGITVHPTQLTAKLKEIGKDHDKTLLQWKSSIEQHQDTVLCLEIVKQCLQSLEYLPQLPQIGQLCSYLMTNGQSDCSLTYTSGVCGDEDTIDASSLNLACLYNPTDVAQSIGNKLLERHVSPKIIKDTCAFVAKSTEPGDDALNAINKSIKVAKHSAPKGFQIIGDNLGLHINVRHMDNSNKNKSLHTFNLVAVRDVVSGENLPDVTERTLDVVQVHEFLPSLDDVEKLKKDLIPLWTRVMVKQLLAFHFLKSVVVYHIPHEYSEAMTIPSNQVCL